jgi:hypothetical protein
MIAPRIQQLCIIVVVPLAETRHEIRFHSARHPRTVGAGHKPEIPDGAEMARRRAKVCGATPERARLEYCQHENVNRHLSRLV